jgi:Lrp/AsnC family transcriptional regulator, leucine-responsive regulatory protein
MPSQGRSAASSRQRAGGAPLRTVRDTALSPSPQVALDLIDLRLLLQLSKDARLSQRSLARELGMSAPAIADRISRLERQGVITGYGVRLDWGALGYDSPAYITIIAVQGYQQATIMEKLAALPEVDEVLLVTGAFDMLVRLRVRDVRHLRELLLNRIWQIEGIQRTETSITIAQMKTKDTAEQLLATMIDEQVDAKSATQNESAPR